MWADFVDTSRNFMVGTGGLRYFEGRMSVYKCGSVNMKVMKIDSSRSIKNEIVDYKLRRLDVL